MLKYVLHVFFALLIALSSSHANEKLDLEELWKQDFVLETKKIEIPGYPYAFNPSLIRWNGSFILSFRDIPDPKFSFNSNIGIVWLDENLNLISEPQILNLREHNPNIPCRADDARLVAVGERLFLVYGDNTDEKITRGGFRVYIAELELVGPYFIVKDPECLSSFEGNDPNRREKNWVPFDYNGELYLAYSLSPHKILWPKRYTSSCETICLSSKSIAWEWGELRGGTPALKEGNEYLAFFHSSIEMTTSHSQGQPMPHYVMGAYTFEAEPPFAITKMSPFPIVGKGFFNGEYYKPYWRPIRVVFPCGFASDSHFVWIAYGREDHEMWIAILDKQGLLNSLIPIN